MPGDFGDDPSERAGFEGVLVEEGHGVHGVAQADVASLLWRELVAEGSQDDDYSDGRDVSWDFHRAISSSLM